MLPHASKIGVLFFPSSRSHVGVVEVLRQATPKVPVQLLPLGVDSVDEISERLALAIKEKAEGLIVVGDPRFFDRRQQIAELAVAGRIACTGYVAGYADSGFLIGYGPSLEWHYRRAAYFAARILRGDSPADIPVEQATTYELVINLRTAQTLGIVVPRSMLLQVDRVIE
jgi:putative ABC transport system substrate-binding protein